MVFSREDEGVWQNELMLEQGGWWWLF